MAPNDIRAELIRRGIRQADIARELGIHRVTVNQVIRGVGTSRRVAERIADILGRPVPVVFPSYARN